MLFYEITACYIRVIHFYFAFIRANPSILSQNTFRIGFITSDKKMFHLRESTLRPTFLKFKLTIFQCSLWTLHNRIVKRRKIGPVSI